MIAYLQGKLAYKDRAHVIIDVQGVGYEVHVSLHTYSQLGDQEQIKLLTHLHIKEDSHTLYGFCDDFERAILNHSFMYSLGFMHCGINFYELLFTPRFPPLIPRSRQ